MMTNNYKKHEIPEEFLELWQNTIDFTANIFEVPAGLIMRVWPDEIEVLLSSNSENNPYEKGEMASLNTGLYCETVMATKDLLHVPNALEDEDWKDNPDVKLNMIMYLGIPLMWPGGEVFGTICVLDEKTRNFESKYVELLYELKKIIEKDFRIIQINDNLRNMNFEIIQKNMELEEKNDRLTKFNDILLDRESKIIDLKREVNKLNEEMGNELSYPYIKKEGLSSER